MTQTIDTNAPDVVRFLERLRAVIDGYGDRFTVAEVGGEGAESAGRGRNRTAPPRRPIREVHPDEER